MTTVILNPMKTAISLPDELFQRAEALAKQLGIPRSQLYARALADYLASVAPERITEALDAVYGEEESTIDPSLAAAQSTALGGDEW